ncbi:MAG TPA: helix-turn-helix transcriptional regulator [Thermoanaerobaculia bacterium]|jgi:transcriptional regulator with XRE-family HTH domain
MLHDEIREARIAHGYSQSKLSKLAGVPRTRLRMFEEGGNITIETLEKIVNALPNLKTVTIGRMQMRTHAEPGEMKEALEDLIAAAQRIIKLASTSAAVSEPGQTASKPRKAARGRRVESRES